MNISMKSFFASLFFILLLPVNAQAFEELKILLKETKAPAGVVIEITSGDPLYLEKIIPEVRADIALLQKKFNKLPVAIVSHARESLILATKSTDEHKELHNQIKDLSDKTNTTIHVCGTYASWFNISENEFPEYINVSPAGPVQVDDYVELGYIHIEL